MLVWSAHSPVYWRAKTGESDACVSNTYMRSLLPGEERIQHPVYYICFCYLLVKVFFSLFLSHELIDERAQSSQDIFFFIYLLLLFLLFLVVQYACVCVCVTGVCMCVFKMCEYKYVLWHAQRTASERMDVLVRVCEPIYYYYVIWRVICYVRCWLTGWLADVCVCEMRSQFRIHTHSHIERYINSSLAMTWAL